MTHSNRQPLDPYSTSPKNLYSDLGDCAIPRCIYHAPFFAYSPEKNTHFIVSQGNCHHWDCPKCGVGRAKEEYWKIVNGCAELEQQKYKLWFMTITTRGSELSVADAEKGYLEWTNRLLNRLHENGKARGLHWCYVQVTERQKRKHPHSHILTTWYPADIFDSAGELFYGCKSDWKHDAKGNLREELKDAIRSDYLQRSVCSAGLGEQYDISEVRDAAAVARYVGKYLFKSSLLTSWPDRWKRVRYSQNWPKQPEMESTAFALITKEDWYNLATCAETITLQKDEEYAIVAPIMWAYPVKVRLRKKNK